MAIGDTLNMKSGTSHKLIGHNFTSLIQSLQNVWVLPRDAL